MSGPAASRREHFIPFSRADIVRRALAGGLVATEDQPGFRDACELLVALFHFEFHGRLETLKALYAPFNPDHDARPAATGTTGTTGATAEASASSAGLAAQRAGFVAALAELLERANYARLQPGELERALAEESAFQLRLHVELDDFDELLLFARGLHTASVEVRGRWPARRRRTVPLDAYERVVVWARFRPAEHFAEERRARLAFQPGATILKLFRNIPRADLEMLLPNVEVRMTGKDRLLIGVPAVIGGAIVVVTKLGASLLFVGGLVAFWLGARREPVTISSPQLAALGLGLAALGGFMFRQIGNFKNRKIRFMKALTDNLYFKNLDNDSGVFHRILDAAEEEEGKEAILAWAFLLQQPGLTEDELDRRVEAWFRDEHGTELDFEVDDALAKLLRLGLVSRGAGGRLTAVPVAEGRRRLDERWDGLFAFAGAAPGAAGAADPGRRAQRP